MGREAFKKAIKLFKKTNKAEIILAEIHEDNIFSQKFFEKLGF